jgi:methionine sulfoxide reductase catalytic subunit
MRIITKKEIPGSEITDPQLFYQRRKLIKAVLASTVTGLSLYPPFSESLTKVNNLPVAVEGFKNEDITPNNLVKNYTNYYEFTFNKEDSTKLVQNLQIDPWSVEITGEVEKPATLHLEDLLSQQSLNEYVYRLRCVEGWSMVVPWVGFPLADLIKRVHPLSTAKFVKFTSTHQPKVMDNQMLQWPYVEGLRIDEATHPLTILAIGMYGDKLPKQNGAPLRLVVPWKYGFKSIKAIVKIELLKNAPITTWNLYAPKEYGFYANVNPAVPHPRWSQISERQIGSGFFTPRKPTELFNGYGDQVASMYSDMDLVHFF